MKTCDLCSRRVYFWRLRVRHRNWLEHLTCYWDELRMVENRGNRAR